MNPQSFQRLLAKIPPKWALAIVGLCLVYGLVQPIANRQLGWNLPSIFSVLGVADRRPPEIATKREQKNDHPRQPSDVVSPTDSSDFAAQQSDDPTTSAELKNSSTSEAISGPQSGQDKRSQTQPKLVQPEKLLYGILKDAGRENFISVKGLRYGPGSEEGHRLKHLERHLADMPNRPGKHGVFDGDMPQVLAWIDDAYDRAARGAKGVRKQHEENRTVLEVPFEKPIGYIGGRDGARSKHPPSKRLRLVIEGNRFITAFPY